MQERREKLGEDRPLVEATKCSTHAGKKGLISLQLRGALVFLDIGTIQGPTKEVKSHFPEWSSCVSEIKQTLEKKQT